MSNSRDNYKNELLQKQAEIKAELAKIKQEELNEALAQNEVKLNVLRENRDLILSLVEHSRTSCSDENNMNGLHSDGDYRCAKCALIDVLDDEWSNNYKVEFSVTITKIN